MRIRVVFIGIFSLLAAVFGDFAGVNSGFVASVKAQSVSQVIVQGNQRIEAETVRSYMQINPGDSFSPDLIDQSLQNLFQTGLFADVQIRRSGNNLIVVVEENPIVNRIAFEGNDELDDEALNKEVQMRPRTVFTRARVQADVDRLVTLYRRSGLFNVRIEPKVVRLPQNRVDLVFEIYEGEKTNVESITFIGNRKYSDDQLRDVITTAEAVWWKFFSTADTYDPDRLEYDKELLRRHYANNGFADFRVLSATAELAPNGQDFFITFTVEEGQQYKVGAITVDPGDTDITEETMHRLVISKTGEIYDASQVEASVERITLVGGRKGYAFAKVIPDAKRDPDTLTIDLNFKLIQGPRVYIERIDIVGNVRTIDKVIRRQIRLVEGDAFNRLLVDRARRRITALDYFETVEILEQPGSAADKIVLIVKVQEKSTGTLNFSAGYSTTEGLIGSVSVTERNLFGRGQIANLNTSLSFKRQSVDFSFTEPYFLDRNLSAGIDLFALNTDNQSEASFDSQEVGGALRMGFPVSRNSRVNTRYQINQRNLTNISPFASKSIKEQAGKTLKSSVGATYVYSTLDNPLEPTRGFRGILAGDFAGVGGEVNYYRADGSLVGFHTIYDGFVLMGKLSGGYIEGWGGQEVRSLDRFYKGAASFRGFESAGIGPRGIPQVADTSTEDPYDTMPDYTLDPRLGDSLGGRAYAIATTELSFPLGLPDAFGLRGVVFGDVGSVFLPVEKVEVRSCNCLRAAVGAGVLWKSPFGPLRLDFTQALLKESWDKTEVFRFAAGTSF
ncbi:MAG: outer membrane protein assembly factor BamA [Hyphomicrobiales bacterium]